MIGSTSLVPRPLVQYVHCTEGLGMRLRFYLNVFLLFSNCCIAPFCPAGQNQDGCAAITMSCDACLSFSEDCFWCSLPPVSAWQRHCHQLVFVPSCDQARMCLGTSYQKLVGAKFVAIGTCQHLSWVIKICGHRQRSQVGIIYVAMLWL